MSPNDKRPNLTRDGEAGEDTAQNNDERKRTRCIEQARLDDQRRRRQWRCCGRRASAASALVGSRPAHSPHWRRRRRATASAVQPGSSATTEWRPRSSSGRRPGSGSRSRWPWAFSYHPLPLLGTRTGLGGRPSPTPEGAPVQVRRRADPRAVGAGADARGGAGCHWRVDGGAAMAAAGAGGFNVAAQPQQTRHARRLYVGNVPVSCSPLLVFSLWLRVDE